MKVVTTIHSYTRRSLADAMKLVTEEANDSTGYELIGFQVVESEKSVVALYRKSTSEPYGEASLVG